VNKIYFSSDGAAWTEYSVMPAGALLLFESACPSGWTANATIDSKFWKGAPTAVWSGLVSGGAATHVHEMSDLINHTHGNAAQVSITTVSEGDHSHSFDQRSGSGGATLPYTITNKADTTINSDGAGNHSHVLTIPAHNTEDTGDAAPDYELLLCRKD
jgi:hypothetical protein